MRRKGSHKVIHGLLFMLLLVMNGRSDAGDVWLLVDTQALVLSVMRGDVAVDVFSNISIGRNGADYEKRRGDEKTPLGEYRIGWINENSRYYRFFGFNYPTLANAKRALKAGLIDLTTFRLLIWADLNEKTPPQDTPLGGQIGIHGLGKADLAIHRRMNWTQGCIALTNEQIDRLRHWIRKGTLVIIQ